MAVDDEAFTCLGKTYSADTALAHTTNGVSQTIYTQSSIEGSKMFTAS